MNNDADQLNSNLKLPVEGNPEVDADELKCRQRGQASGDASASRDTSHTMSAPVPSTLEHSNRPDPFDLAAVKRRSMSAVAVKKTLVVRVTKRVDKGTWFQVSPDPGMHVEGYLLDAGDMADGLFWIAPHALTDIDDSTIRLYELHLCASKFGAVFWWAIGLPGEDGRDMECDRVRRAYATTHGQWMRLEWDQAARMHNQTVALAAWPGPDWPNATADELIRAAFRDRVIDSADHPVIQQIKGLA